MQNIIDDFFIQVNRHPDKIAVWCEGETITYEEMGVMVNKLSHFMISKGVKPGDHIGVLLSNNIYFVALILVASNIGVALVPLNLTLPAEAIYNAFQASDVKHIVSNIGSLKDLDKKTMKTVDGVWMSIDEKYPGTFYLGEEIINMPKTRIQEINLTGNETLILTLTSGSTGKPKPIILTQKNKYDRAMAAIDLYSITHKDVILAATPLYHSLAERLVIIPLLIGGTSILMSRFSPTLWLDCVKNQSVTFTIAVSSQLVKIAEVLNSPFLPDINTLKCLVSSSAQLEDHVKAELLAKLKCNFHECYGTSEIAIATDLDITTLKKKLKSVGRMASNVDVKILTADGRIVENGESGEIICKTPMLFGGYYKLPEMTEKAMVQGYFKTGDLGLIDEDGFLYFLGREKDIIISGGINIYPRDIEDIICQMPSVEECVAFPYPDENLGEIIAVAIVLRAEGEFNERETKFHCVKNLADFQQPRKYFVISQLPRNNMGKIMKHELLDQLL